MRSGCDAAGREINSSAMLKCAEEPDEDRASTAMWRFYSTTRRRRSASAVRAARVKLVDQDTKEGAEQRPLEKPSHFRPGPFWLTASPTSHPAAACVPAVSCAAEKERSG